MWRCGDECSTVLATWLKTTRQFFFSNLFYACHCYIATVAAGRPGRSLGGGDGGCGGGGGVMEAWRGGSSVWWMESASICLYMASSVKDTLLVHVSLLLSKVLVGWACLVLLSR